MARMLRARSLLLLLALLLALPACGDDGDAPPAPGIPGDAGADASTSTDGSTAPDAGTESDGSTAPDGSTEPDGSTSPDGSADGGGEDDALWAAWGTAGSTRETGVSTGGHAICNLDDVRADDLDLAAFDLEVPPFPYAASIVPDATSRCGADPDTLLYRLVNCERLSRGLSPYLCDRRMVWAARRHTLDQLENDFMSHAGSDGSSFGDRLGDANVAYWGAAENVAYAFSLLGLHFGWMDSSGHRSAILSVSYDHFGASAGRSGSTYRGTQLFVTAR